MERFDRSVECLGDRFMARHPQLLSEPPELTDDSPEADRIFEAARAPDRARQIQPSRSILRSSRQQRWGCSWSLRFHAFRFS